jgi:2-polyprenyl-3-methyl-5-hydroxy-6-metoxy-1,4-benzoquinol methylase
VLDIGCGVGSLHLTLLKEGADQSLGVDLSEGMLEEAKRFAQEFGVTERTEYLTGDFTQLSQSIPENDITILDKVVCCYEDVDFFANIDEDSTNLCLSHPQENLLMKLSLKALDLAGIFISIFILLAQLGKCGLSCSVDLVWKRPTSWQVLVYQ